MLKIEPTNTWDKKNKNINETGPYKLKLYNEQASELQHIWMAELKWLRCTHINGSASANAARANLPIMNLAFWIAARVVSTLGPSVQKPWVSGRLTWISATSRLNTLRRNNNGTSLRKIGMKSARPSLTALRQFGPMNSELDRNMPTN